MDVRGDAPFPPRLIHHRRRSEATGISGCTLRGHGELQRPETLFPLPRPRSPLSLRVPVPVLDGRPLLPRSAELPVARCPEKPAVSPSPFSVRPTWGDLELCATTCRISNVPFCKSCKVAGCSSSPGAGWVTGSESPTPPPPPSLCPARTSCPRAGARLTHRCPRVGGRGWRVPPRTGRAELSGGRPALGLAC